MHKYACNTPQVFIFPHGATAPSGPRPPDSRRFMITFRHPTLGRTPVGEWLAWHTQLYLTKHNTQNRQTSMPRRYSNP